jgi:hypothetical protein
MIRRLNYTGRKKIPRSRVSIHLATTIEGHLAFDTTLNLDRIAFPGNAKIFVEAYRRAFFKRFPCGTVSNPRLPKSCVLEGFDSRSLVLFRIKVTDPKGRLLGVADKIIPRRPEEESADKLCLLPVDFVDLGRSIWRLDLAGDPPSLQLNKNIENIREMARSDGSFLSLVYPEVVRQVFHKIIVDENHTDPDTDPEDWMSRWIHFAMSILGKRLLPPEGESEPILQEKLRWIDDVVDAFSASNQLLEKFVQAQRIREQ